jgi:hypothetical protein
MTDLSTIEINPDQVVEIRATGRVEQQSLIESDRQTGHDMNSLLFAYMDNLLDQLQSEKWVTNTSTILSLTSHQFLDQKN